MNAVVFDLDGTLVHSAPDLHAAAAKMLAEWDLVAPDLEAVTAFIGNGIPALVKGSLAFVGAEHIDSDLAIDRFRLHYAAHPASLTEPYPGVRDMLDRLRAEGFRLGVCTNKSADLSAKVLEGVGLEDYFDQVIGGDTLAVCKPAPEPLIVAFERLGHTDLGNLYVGDSEIDAATAAAAHRRFALFSGGYRKAPVDDLKADFVFDDFTVLTDFILTGRGPS